MWRGGAGGEGWVYGVVCVCVLCVCAGGARARGAGRVHAGCNAQNGTKRSREPVAVPTTPPLVLE